MLIGCYVLHIRCTYVGHNSAISIQEEFTGETKAQALEAARKGRWQFDLEHGAAFCPSCSFTKKQGNKRLKETKR